jgi:uncharacterized protein (DUF1778 family)
MASEIEYEEYSVGMRLGSSLLERITRHAYAKGESRNTWLINAARRQIKRGRALKAKTTARELLRDKQPLILRVDGLTLELIDEACDELAINRTVWMMDAALSRMQEQPLSKMRRR